MTTLYMSPASLIVQYLTNIGVLAAGGQVFTFLAGTVSTPLTTYTDSTGVNPNPNPMTLNSAGRPASASGAPVAFWHQAGVSLTLQVFDASGNLLVNLPNIPALNDPDTSGNLQTALANPAPGEGVDLVANALKSYDVVASVQSVVSPQPAAGQTLIICLEGGASIGDGKGGLFFWDPTSTQADDGGITCIEPAGAPATGRYLRLLESSIGAFQGTLSGMTTTTVGTFGFSRVGNHVTLWTGGNVYGTSSTQTLTMTGLPAEVTPLGTRRVACVAVQNNGADIWAEAQVTAAGAIIFLAAEATGSPALVQAAPNLFTNSGNKGLSAGWTISYETD